MIVLIWICIGLALLLWPFLIALNNDLTGSDAAGNGIAQGLAVLGTISIWSLLGIALLLAGLRGLIPVWALLIALVLVPLSGFAAGNITDLISHSDNANWLIIVQVAVPPLLALYLAWATVPGFHAALSPRMAGAIVWIAVLVLSALPWPQVIALPGLEQKRYDDWQAHRDALFARFNELTVNGSVEGWWHFLDTAEDQRDAAVQQIKNYLDRQPKIEALLKAGDGSGFPALYDMDLSPTPELCAAARQFLQQRIPGFKPATVTAQYADIRDTVESYETTLRWLAKNRCDIRPELDAFQAVLTAYPDHESAILFTTALDEMRRDLSQ